MLETKRAHVGYNKGDQRDPDDQAGVKRCLVVVG